jgi:phosphoribosylformimino-5-aminoimidazole carboxamide ribotide isomerase
VRVKNVGKFYKAMIIIPAIDLLDGRVVRLLQGDYSKVKIYSDNPVKIAKEWADKGAKRLHMVDLNGARHGSPAHLDIVKQIVKNTDIAIEFGGGIRSIDMIQNVLNCGCSYAIIGTKAGEDLKFVKKAQEMFKEKIIVSIDSKNGFVAIQGWEKTTKIKAIDAAMQVEGMGIKTVIYTDISRDGMMQGANIEAVKSLLQQTSVDVIISGGIATVSDIQNISRLGNPRIIGCIIGKALYEGKIKIEELLRFQ